VGWRRTNMSNKTTRVLARDILATFGSLLDDPSTEAANKHNDPAKKEMMRSWINGIIKIRGNNLEDLNDLRRGNDYIVLLEVLSGYRLTTGYRQPHNFVEMANNLELFLKFLRHVGIDTVITAMDLYEGKFEKVMFVLVQLAKTFEEKSDVNKTLEAFSKHGLSKAQNKRLSQKMDKQLQPIELKLEQAILDQIYQLAAIHQAEIDHEEARKKEAQKNAKKLTALALLSQSEVDKLPLFFTAHLPDSTKDIRDFDTTLPILELIETICLAKGWNKDEYFPKTMDDKDVDIDYVLGEIKDREIKLVYISLVVGETKPEIPKPEKRVRRMDPRGKSAPQIPTAQHQSVMDSTNTSASGRRTLVRQNSYVSLKAWDPKMDEDEQESLKRVKARSNAFGKARDVKAIKSPLVLAMEKEHKAMLEKLNLDDLKMPPPISNFRASNLQNISLSSLDKALRDLEAFEHIYGANQEFAPDNFFKDLL